MILFGLAVPIQALLIPNYVIMVKLRLYDTLYGLVLVTAASLIAISVLLTVNYVRLIPEELYDAMAIDGARAPFPLCAPAPPAPPPLPPCPYPVKQQTCYPSGSPFPRPARLVERTDLWPLLFSVIQCSSFSSPCGGNSSRGSAGSH